jgi:hypothetical protein
MTQKYNNTRTTQVYFKYIWSICVTFRVDAAIWRYVSPHITCNLYITNVFTIFSLQLVFMCLNVCVLEIFLILNTVCPLDSHNHYTIHVEYNTIQYNNVLLAQAIASCHKYKTSWVCYNEGVEIIYMVQYFTMNTYIQYIKSWHIHVCEIRMLYIHVFLLSICCYLTYLTLLR